MEWDRIGIMIISHKTSRLVLSSLSYLPNTRHRLLAQDFFSGIILGHVVYVGTYHTW